MDKHNNTHLLQSCSGASENNLDTALPPCFDSTELLGNDGLAVITHQGQRYQLRQTKAGKLILTK